MPKIWDDTIEAHRRAVRDAALDAVAELVAERGLTSVTMSQIAERTGIGRATLYKYFPDVEAILLAWHERQIAAHLELLEGARDQPGNADRRLEAVLETYALIAFESHAHNDSELSALLHRGEHVPRAQQHLEHMVRDLIVDAATNGRLRGDMPPEELANYCLYALAAAGRLRSKAAVQRLVRTTLAGLGGATRDGEPL